MQPIGSSLEGFSLAVPPGQKKLFEEKEKQKRKRKIRLAMLFIR